MYKKNPDSYNLENKIENNYKSEGERKIADFLNRYDIHYVYEKPTLVQDRDSKLRVWYPDYTLPEFDIILEYYGLAGDNEYDKGIKRKQEVYLNGNNKVISVYPSMFRENWQGYILESIRGVLETRNSCLESKIVKYKVGKGSSGRY